MKNQKLTYISPEVGIDLIDSEDIVLISVHDEKFILDDHAVKWEDLTGQAGW